MTKKSGPKHRIALLDNYRSAIGAAVLLLLSVTAHAQVIPPPSQGYAIRYNRVIPDSVQYLPTACGVPTDSTFLFSQNSTPGLGKAAKGAIYIDSCGHHIYFWDPSTKSWHIIDGGSGGGGSGFSIRDIVSSNFSTSVNCPLPALNNDSLQVFWNDIGRFLLEGTEWQNLSGGGFKILLPGFDATSNSYTLTLYANNIASPPGPVNFTSSNFSTSTNCPIASDNGMTLQIFWNDAQRYLVQGVDFAPITGGGFTIIISGFDATTSNYSFYVFAQ